MAITYPVILSQDKEGYLVTIPDFNVNTQGYTKEDAIYMARDAIGMLGTTLEAKGEELPQPFSQKYEKEKSDIEILVYVDFDEYRK